MKSIIALTVTILARISGTFLLPFPAGQKVSYKSQAVLSIQVQTIKDHSLGLYIGCPRPLNTGVQCFTEYIFGTK